MADIAIIGGGMAGLTCAAQLAKQGVQTVTFDKGRGPGGRMASRRVELDGETVRFDHGTRFFSATTPAFAEEVSSWVDGGFAAPWPAAGPGQYVGVPGMNGPLAAMASELEVNWGSRVLSVVRSDGRWTIELENETRDFAQIIVAIPAEQAAEMLAQAAPEMAKLASGVSSQPCWTVMAAFDRPLPIDADVLSDPASPIAEASRDTAKPGRGGVERWVLQASAAMSESILEREPQDVGREVLRQFFVQQGISAREPVHLAAHRWRYAFPNPVIGKPARYDPELGLALAGDWLTAPNVEGAYMSGMAAAGLILSQPD